MMKKIYLTDLLLSRDVTNVKGVVENVKSFILKVNDIGPLMIGESHQQSHDYQQHCHHQHRYHYQHHYHYHLCLGFS